MTIRSVFSSVVLSSAIIASVCLARPDEKHPWKPVLSENDYTKLVAIESKTIQDALAKSGEKKMVTKAKVASLMLAAYAQSQMLGDTKKAGQLAGLRDKAIAVAKAISDDKLDEAKKLAGELNAASSGKTEIVELHKMMDLDELMTQFKPEASGGKALEKKIKQYMQKKAALSADEIKDCIVVANQTAIIAQYTEMFGPETDMGKKTKADWIKWSKEMGEIGVDAAKLSSAPKADDKAIKAAFKKLDDNCAKCHAVWREQ